MTDPTAVEGRLCPVHDFDSGFCIGACPHVLTGVSVDLYKALERLVDRHDAEWKRDSNYWLDAIFFARQALAKAQGADPDVRGGTP